MKHLSICHLKKVLGSWFPLTDRLPAHSTALIRWELVDNLGTLHILRSTLRSQLVTHWRFGMAADPTYNPQKRQYLTSWKWDSFLHCTPSTSEYFLPKKKQQQTNRMNVAFNVTLKARLAEQSDSRVVTHGSFALCLRPRLFLFLSPVSCHSLCCQVE